MYRAEPSEEIMRIKDGLVESRVFKHIKASFHTCHHNNSVQLLIPTIQAKRRFQIKQEVKKCGPPSPH